MNPIGKLRSLFRKGKLETEMAEELRHHVELQAELNRKAGMDPDEARYAALRQFGNVAAIQERAREARGWRWLEDFLQDLRHGARLLRKNPGFTAAAAAVLALGIGVNTAIFNLVHTLLLAPPTYARPAEMMRLQLQDSRNPKKTREFSYAAYRDIREGNVLFSETLASALLVTGVGEQGATRRAAAAVVSANYFSVLGVAPARGRAFRPEEETPGAAPVVIVSHRFWQKHQFDPTLLGSTLLINSRPFTVVGIMPEGFTGTTNLFFTELWLPLGAHAQVAGNAATGADFMILGRLKPGLPAAAAGPALRLLEAGLARNYPAEQQDQVLVMAPPSRFASAGNDTAVAWVGVLLLGMAAVVLLVACLNLANMLLARGAARRKEIALRLALGGGRLRIVRQLLTEGLLLALLGGVGGLVLALWSSEMLIASLSGMIPLDLVWAAAPQPALLAATFAFCVLGTLGFALGPALRLSRGDILAHLKEHAGEDVVRRRWKLLPRHPLVSLQIALTLALLTSAVLFIRQAEGTAGTDTGLRADRVFLAELDAGLGGFDRTQAQDLYQRLGERLGALPGVESASVATDVPLSDLDFERQVQRLGDAKSATSAKWTAVGADYFPTAGLTLLRGRGFTAAEATQPGSPAVAVINEQLARKLWPDGDALGQHLQLSADETEAGRPGAGAASAPVYEVVGIVPATRHTLFESRPDAGIYLPFARGFRSRVYFHVRFASLPPGREQAAADLLRRAIRETDPMLPVLSLQSFAQHLDSNIQVWLVRAGAALFTAFGALALGIAVVGAYGVVAYSVARRSREIGIRMALGARPEVVQRMILREGAVMLGGGLALGLLLALGVGKIVGSLLYQGGAVAPVIFLVAPGVLVTATLLACWLPARRATKVDPMIALRAE